MSKRKRQSPIKPGNSRASTSQAAKIMSGQVPKNGRWRSWFTRNNSIRILKITGVVILVLFIMLVGTFAYFRKDIPDLKGIYGKNLAGSVTYYDRTGKVALWQDYSAVKRIPVSSGQISPYMKDATVAIEDKNFYHEGAFNIGSIVRAAAHDIIHRGQGLEGASTITEQVVKLNAGWADPLTISEKVKEIILATEISREYSKDDIITAYLNIAPYGGVEYGCQSAAQDYFHTSCKNLTLAQAAFLASIPQAPSVYSPYSSPQYNSQATANYFDQKALLGRWQYVLQQMAQQHLVSQAQVNKAKQTNILAEVQPLQSTYNGIIAPYFVLAAKQQLQIQYGAQLLKKGSWKVMTTLSVSCNE